MAMAGKLNRRAVLALLAIAGVLGAGAAALFGRRRRPRLDPERHPNIVLIVADDMRWDAMGSAGNPVVKTPTLDRLAAEGARFENGFVTTSICPTSRASIVTGLHLRRHGIERFDAPLKERHLDGSFPAVLRRAGYWTGFVGKWGLGGPLPKAAFDRWAGFSGQGRYFAPAKRGDRHLTDAITDRVLAFLREAPDDRPFCLMVSYKAPHVQDGARPEFQPPRRLERLYEKVPIAQPRSASPAHFEALPGFIRTSEARTRWRRRFASEAMRQRTVARYYSLITGLDEGIGRIVASLRGQGLYDRTAIVFTSDNGFLLGEHGLAGKWVMYEESIRIPLIVKPHASLKSRAGQRIGTMALNTDIAPTMLELAGIADRVRRNGRSLVPALTGTAVGGREAFYYEHPERPRIPGCEGVRTARWKYARYTLGVERSETLFDLDNDRFEEHNLAGRPEAAARLTAMRRRLANMRRSIGRG